MNTGLVRWEWHSLDHVAAGESEVEASTSTAPWDYFHLNSIDLEPDGDLLISARNTWAAYQLAGGHRQDPLAPRRPEELVQDGPGHAAPPGSTTRACCPTARSRSSTTAPTRRSTSSRAACAIALDLSHPRSAPGRRLHPRRPAAARRQPGQHADARRAATSCRLRRRAGDQRVLARTARLLFDAHLPYDMSFYRAFRYPWSARAGEPAGGRGQRQQHRRRDDRARELERRHRRRLLAGARRQDAQVADGAGDVPASGFESDDDPARRATPTSQVQALDGAAAACSAARRRRDDRASTPSLLERERGRMSAAAPRRAVLPRCERLSSSAGFVTCVCRAARSSSTRSSSDGERGASFCRRSRRSAKLAASTARQR